jgi:hypothetical protein
MSGRKPRSKHLTPTGYRVTMPHRLVRDPHFSSLLEEYGRSFMGKDLPVDPTVAKVLAMARGTTEILGAGVRTSAYAKGNNFSNHDKDKDGSEAQKMERHVSHWRRQRKAKNIDPELHGSRPIRNEDARASTGSCFDELSTNGFSRPHF